MWYRLARTLRMYVYARLIFLIGIAHLVVTDVLGFPLSDLLFVALIVSWLGLSCLLLVGLRRAYRAVVAATHLGDALMLSLVVLANGGNTCPAAYLLMLLVIPAGLLVGKPFAWVLAAALEIFHLTLLFTGGATDYLQLLFWVVYGISILAYTHYLLATRELKRYKLLYSELEEREHDYEKSIAALENASNDEEVADELSKLKDFSHFRERIREEVKRASSEDHPFSLCVMGIKNLAEFKDKHGTSTCRDVLEAIGNSLKEALRGSDIATRYHDDRFMFFFPETSAEHAITPAKRLRDHLLEAQLCGFPGKVFEYRIGIAGFPEDARKEGTLIGMAIVALQHALNEDNDDILVATSLYTG